MYFMYELCKYMLYFITFGRIPKTVLQVRTGANFTFPGLGAVMRVAAMGKFCPKTIRDVTKALKTCS